MASNAAPPLNYCANTPLNEVQIAQLQECVARDGYDYTLFNTASDRFCLYPITTVHKKALIMEMQFIHNWLSKGLVEDHRLPSPALQMLLDNARLIPIVTGGTFFKHITVANEFLQLDINLVANIDKFHLVKTRTEIVKHDLLRTKGYTVIIDYAENNSQLAFDMWCKHTCTSVEEQNVVLLNCQRAPWPFLLRCINKLCVSHLFVFHATHWNAEHFPVSNYLWQNYFSSNQVTTVTWDEPYYSFLEEPSTMKLNVYSTLGELLTKYKSSKNRKDARETLHSYLAVYNGTDTMSKTLRQQIVTNMPSTNRDRSYSYTRETSGGIMVANPNDFTQFFVHFNDLTYCVQADIANGVKARPFTNLKNLKFRVDHLFLIAEKPLTDQLLQSIAHAHAIYSLSVLRYWQ